MSAALENTLRLLQLAVPALLGALAGRIGLFDRPEQAISALNTYALYFAFPALIARGLIEAQVALPHAPAFYLAWPLTLALALFGARLLSSHSEEAHDQLGTVGLVICFGNVAYLGLPYAQAVFGPNLAGAAALAVSIHVVLAVTVGPAVLARWSPRADPPAMRELAARLVRMPLLWAPAVGLAARWLPDVARREILDWSAPLAGSAAPVALFLLGLYTYRMRAHLRRVDGAALAHVAARAGLAPTLMLGVSAALVSWAGLDPAHGRLYVLLAAMPAAITTFSMAHDAGQGEPRVAATIVWTSALAPLTLPLWMALARAALGPE